MSGTPKFSEAKHALLEKYLRGDLPQNAKAIPQDAKAETTGHREGVVAIQAGGARRPFFYLHGDWQANTFYCYPLAQALGADQPFYVLAPYTYEGLLIPPPLETIAKVHLESLRSIQPEGPYLLGGWCNGAVVAYEMARQLHAQGQAVDLLVLMDAPLPGRHSSIRRVISRLVGLLRRGQEKELDWFLIVHHVYRYLRFPHYRQRIKSEQMGIDEQSARGYKRGKGRFGLPRLGWLFMTAQVLRQDYLDVFEWVLAGYTPNLYPGKITLFWAKSEETGYSVEWREVVQAKEGKVEIYVIPGNDHTSRTEYLHVLAEKLRDCVNKVQTPTMS
jgi:thioesterase superfamily protein